MSIAAYLPLLKLIAQEQTPTDFVINLPDCVIDVISEISYNLIYGSILLSEAETQNLKKSKAQLLKLGKKNLSSKSKRKLVTPVLISSIVAPLVKYLNGTEDTDNTG